jgi:hypothetical protein
MVFFIAFKIKSSLNPLTTQVSILAALAIAAASILIAFRQFPGMI